MTNFVQISLGDNDLELCMRPTILYNKSAVFDGWDVTNLASILPLAASNQTWTFNNSE